jgi:hypothetical protein
MTPTPGHKRKRPIKGSEQCCVLRIARPCEIECVGAELEAESPVWMLAVGI